ncbi:hypothetical protein BGC_30070 [Burkholderia sp. 3C]
MFSAPTTTSPALPAMPDRNDFALLVLDEAAACVAGVFWEAEDEPDGFVSVTSWLKRTVSSANAPEDAETRTPTTSPATARLQA